MGVCWLLLFTASLVAAASTQDAYTLSKIKRQTVSFDFGIEEGPSRETLLLVNDKFVVYLAGFNASRTEIRGSQTVMFSSAGLTVTDTGGGRMSFDTVTQYTYLSDSSTFCYNKHMPAQNVGPGVLYTSTNHAMFTDVANHQVIVDNLIARAPELLPDIEVVEVMDASKEVSRLDVNNGEFEMTMTGASTARLGTSASQRITYSGNTVTVMQGAQTTTFDGITTFGAYRFPPGDTPNPMFTSFTSGTSEVFRGPGQLYVNEGEITAFYIENVSFRSGGILQDVSASINMVVFSSTVNIQPGDNTVTVSDRTNMPLITLTSSTRTTSLPNVQMAIYFGSTQTLTFTDGRTTTFNNIMMFSVYDNNDVTTFTTASPNTTLTVSGGGTVYVDDVQGTALFATDSNPIVNQQLRNVIPSVTETFTFNLDTNPDDVRSLSVTRTNTSSGATQTQTIQTLTGAYTTSVGELQTLIYDNSELNILFNFNGDVLQSIENVDELVVNTGSIPFTTFGMSSSVPFIGPGTLSYSRGTAFFTSSPTLGSSITSFSQSAPVPDIGFKAQLLGTVAIDDLNTTQREVIMTVGGDTVVTFEATSYNTRPDQEVLYAGGAVTVHQRPISTSNVQFNGNTQTVTYTTDTGEVVTLNNVMMFYLYTGGAVTTPNNFTSSVPSSLYVSADGTEVLFSTSNVITSEVATLIHGLVTTEFMVSANQFSSIYAGVYNLSTDQATVPYLGGGIIYSSKFNGTNLSFYTENEDVIDQILWFVSSILGLTKTQVQESNGFMHIIFNGRVLYTYAPVPANYDIVFGNTDTFIFNGTALIGNDLPGGSHTGIHEVIYFNGIEEKVFNISNAPMEFEGRGLLLTRFDSDVAFYTTSPSAINFLVQAIGLQRRFLIAPELQRPRQATGSTKFRFATFDLGQRVTAYQGADISFVCKVRRGHPQPIIQFFFGDQLLNGSSPGIIIVTDTLTVTNIQLEDAGNYRCVADNGIPPTAQLTSTLIVRRAVAPQVRPYWFPFPIEAGQRIFWPNSLQVQASVDVQRYDELVFACRVEGRPKAEVMWTINGLSPGDVVQNFTVHETQQGRSVLIVDISDDEQRMLFSNQRNTIQCTAMNDAGSTSGSVALSGSFYDCMEDADRQPDCSRTCGFGTFRVVYTCDRTTNGVTTMNVSLSEVPSQLIADQVRICTPKDADNNTIPCPITEFRWNTTEWTECSRTCGVGSQTRNITCLERKIPVNNRYQAELNNTVISEEVDVSMCVMFEGAGTRPADYQLCNEQSCPFWQAEQFSNCSVTCGGGVRMRDVQCVREVGRYVDMNGKVQLNLTIANDSDCDVRDRPSDTKTCNTFPCFLEWRTEPYKQCGDIPVAANDFQTCKFRNTFCYYELNVTEDDLNVTKDDLNVSKNDLNVSKNDLNVSKDDLNVTNDDLNVTEEMGIADDSYCNSLQRPTALTHCSGECPYGIWEVGLWSKCSESCGYGKQTRSIQCLSPRSFQIVPNNFCLPHKRPATTQQCFIQNCPGMCTADENRSLCPLLAKLRMCNTALAMGDTGTKCCYSCMGRARKK